MTIKLIVGLANPGAKYSATRHNAGAWYINLLVKKFCAELRKETKFFGYTSCINFANANVHLLVPNTFMNLSGKAVATMAAFYHINPNEILVIHDELDLPPGIAKFKLGGTHNNHNGLRDISIKLGSNSNFYRLRVGIGHPGDKNKIIDFLLSKPTIFEQNMINKALNEAIRCTEIWLQDNLTKAVNNLHSFKARQSNQIRYKKT